MSDPFVSPLFVAGGILVAMSFTMFVETLIVTLGDKITFRR
jgi:hypothetical protein